MRLHTPRFLLRDFVEGDRPAFLAYQMDPRYRRLYDYGDTDEKRAHRLFDRFLSWQHEAPRRDLQLGIFARKTERLCGCAGLRQSGQGAGRAVLGIELTPDDWGRYRLAIEVAGALIAYGFDRLGLDVIVGDTASGNSRVARLARWFGAEIVARREGPDWMKARGWAEVDWALDRHGWERSQSRRSADPSAAVRA